MFEEKATMGEKAAIELGRLANAKFRLGGGTIEIIDCGNRPEWGCCSLFGDIKLIRTRWRLETLAHELAHRRHIIHDGWHKTMTERIHNFLKSQKR